MRIDDDVRLHSRFTEGHVDRGVLLRADTFLSVTRRELVTDDGGTRDPKLDVKLVGYRVSRIVSYKGA
jgi:hypothetical protein